MVHSLKKIQCCIACGVTHLFKCKNPSDKKCMYLSQPCVHVYIQKAILLRHKEKKLGACNICVFKHVKKCSLSKAKVCKDLKERCIHKVYNVAAHEVECGHHECKGRCPEFCLYSGCLACPQKFPIEIIRHMAFPEVEKRKCIMNCSICDDCGICYKCNFSPPTCRWSHGKFTIKQGGLCLARWRC